MHRRISSIALALFIVTVLNLFPVQVLAAKGFTPGDSLAVTGAMGGTSNNGSVSSGSWTEAKSGFRITVLGHDGKPAFTFMGKDSLDLLFSRKDLENTWYFADGDKISDYRGLRTDYKKVDVESMNQSTSGYHSCMLTVADIYNRLIDGRYTTTIPEPNEKKPKPGETGDGKNLKKAIDILAMNNGAPKNLSYPLYSSKKNGKNGWHMGDTSVREDFYGSGSKLANISLLNVLMNLLNTGSGEFLWQPKDAYWNSKSGYWAARVSTQDMDDFKRGDLVPIGLMYKLGVYVSVEPIIWNRLAVGINLKGQVQYMGDPGSPNKVYGGVYGAQSTLGETIEALKTSEYTNLRKNSNADYGGRDVSLFGKVGRKCMNTSSKTVFSSTTGGSFLIEPPGISPGSKKIISGDSKNFITNTEVSRVDTIGNNKDNKMMMGWALHLYYLYSEKKKDVTHTYDIDPPTSPGKAPDPLKYLGEADKKKIGKLAHYNIVKVYQTRDSVTNVVTHDATFTREETIPKILIEHETDYLVKEWKYGLPDPDNPVIDGPTGVGTKWGDDPIKTIVPIESGTKPIPAEVDIANKDDKDEVRTLYVLLEKPTKKPLPPPPPPPPAPSTPASNIITESQLVKAISTDRALVGNNWGSYNFSATLEAAVTSHKYTACCGDCRYDQADGATCNHMRRANNDKYVSATTADQFNGRQVEPMETKGH